MADGGEGTVDAFVDAGWRRIEVAVHGPRGDPLQASFALDRTAAVVEMAAASGLAVLSPQRLAPRETSTFGTGELVRAALDRGARRIVFAIGGSATNDAGAGFLEALGARLLDSRGRRLAAGGAQLAHVACIDLADLDPRLRETSIEIAADVDNPLTGPRGASAVFGPQKGATPADVRMLDAALAHFADVAAGLCGVDPRDEPGSGAAGGLGFTLRAFFGASCRPGVEVVAELRGLAAALSGADRCFTGEGRIDAQTTGGKVIAGVGAMAYAQGVRTIAFAGEIVPEAEEELARLGIVCVPILEGPSTLAEALRDAQELLERTAYRVARLTFSSEPL